MGYWVIHVIEVFVVLTAVSVTGFLFFLPSQYDPLKPGEISEKDFTEADKKDPDRSGYSYFLKNKHTNGTLQKIPLVQIVVLGDIGRSPRMQYHALSLAAHGGFVSLIGYVESDVHPDIEAHRFINVVPVSPPPKWMQTSSALLFLFFAPMKAIWQFFSLYTTIAWADPACKWILVQNPPSIPTLMVAQIMSVLRLSRLAIDWHNFGYSLLALKLGSRNPVVRLAKWYEWFFSNATIHFTVTDAMTQVLDREWNIEAVTLHDRPPKYFQPLSPEQRSEFLKRLPETKEYADDLEKKTWRLLVSSTSWTADEDFSVLLDALVSYSDAVNSDSKLPKILAIITGKGAKKAHYQSCIRTLNQQNKLKNVIIETAWLETEDYARLLGSADLGVSLHTSSSGVDFPMKVVDMFGAGLPVAGWSKFESWYDRVTEGKTGCGFESAKGLTDVLKKLFGGDGKKLEQLRQGALEESKKRWDDAWLAVVGLPIGVRLPTTLQAGLKADPKLVEQLSTPTAK